MIYKNTSNQFQRFFLAIMLTCLTTQAIAADPNPNGKHLFILSGQSNMVGMNPDLTFSPAVNKAFGKDQVIVVKNAHGGQSIRSWGKTNHEVPPPTSGRLPKVRGELYDRLMETVKPAIAGQTLKTVTFIWMQGESDLNNTAYAAYLNEVLAQLEADLSFQKINLVIGRISDSGLDGKRSQGVKNIRSIQQKFAESHTSAAWVDTDDLNDKKVGDKMSNDLHYTKEGYELLGTRFAEKAIELVQKVEK